MKKTFKKLDKYNRFYLSLYNNYNIEKDDMAIYPYDNIAPQFTFQSIQLEVENISLPIILTEEQRTRYAVYFNIQAHASKQNTYIVTVSGDVKTSELFYDIKALAVAYAEECADLALEQDCSTLFDSI